MEEKNKIHLGGGKKFFNDADFMIVVSKNKCIKNPRLEVIRARFIPSNK